jgi:hypothetical protein
MDISKLSDQDLEALAKNDLSAMSDEGLRMISSAPAKSAPKADLTAGEVATGAITNFPRSMGNLIGDIFTAVTNPIQTGKSILDVGAGALQNILPERFVQAVGEDKPSRDMARKVGEFYADRYGTGEGLKRAIAEVLLSDEDMALMFLSPQF